MGQNQFRKAAFVTGAGSGIGRATTAAFSAKGYATTLVDFDEAGGREAEAEIRAAGGQPEEIASAVLWLCDESASYMTGQAIAVDGAWTSC